MSNEALPSNRRRMLSDTELDDTTSEPSNRRRMLSDTELDDTTSEPSKRRRMPPTTELEDTASEGIRGNVRDARTSSRSLTLPPSVDAPHSPRLARAAGILLGESPDNLLRSSRISHPKEVHGNVRNARTPSRSLTLPPPADPPYSPRIVRDAEIMVGKSPGNDRIAVALPRIYEARASITRLQSRPLRNKKAAGDVIVMTAHPGHYGVMEEKQFR
ncbi:hypothetical protein E4U19_008089 [Claviceps sp. Clav32 group G5]|nr:hypothetical protein E4U19_008089 [Claviceps sp. Clav32 group G5]KAG6039294.1 hypothetical protein E4U39_007797 [Claviceps sp. Clav50 group G5]